MPTPGDLNNILISNIAAILALEVMDSQNYPAKSQGVAACNEGVRDLVQRMLPRDLVDNRRTPGRIDKLLRQLGYEVETGNWFGFCRLPYGSTYTPNICYYTLLELGGVPMVEVPSQKLKDLAAGTIFAATAYNPIFSWGYGVIVPGEPDLYGQGINFLPSASTPSIGYHFVLMPTPMEDTGDSKEDWPLDDELMAVDVFYAAGKLLLGSTETVKQQLGGLLMSAYNATVDFIAGPQTVQPSEREVL